MGGNIALIQGVRKSILLRTVRDTIDPQQESSEIDVSHS